MEDEDVAAHVMIQSFIRAQTFLRLKSNTLKKPTKQHIATLTNRKNSKFMPTNLNSNENIATMEQIVQSTTESIQSKENTVHKIKISENLKEIKAEEKEEEKL